MNLAKHKIWDKRATALMGLWGKRFLYLDGGMGTMLQAAGLSGGETPETWNLQYPERVRQVHRQYLAAGCDIVTANTFGATRSHLGDRAAAYMQAGVSIAREAVEAAGHGWAAADFGPLGQLLAPYGDMPFEEAVSQFREAGVAALAAKADLILIETMTDLLETKAAILGAKEAMEEAGRSVPLFCSVTFDEQGRLLTGADIRGTAATLEGLRVDAIGINCGHEPRALMDNVCELLRWSRLPVFVSPNASLPVVENGITTFPTTPEDFGADMKEIAGLGAWGMGGCCGTTPAHIAALIQSTQNMQPLSAVNELHGNETIVSGRSSSLVMGQKPLIIGERLNPTGKPRMKQALREGNMDFLLREAIAQIEAGADMLDVNVGLPDIDEPEMLRTAVCAIQEVCQLPLQLDTADPAALETALRVYCGKPLINSVCGKQSVMDAVFPLAARYGGAIVALVLDETGIPETAEGRLQVARRIIAEAEKYGIAASDLVFDALTMTVSTNENAALVTLETVERLTQELGVKTILGVSNVSFGLPQRPLLTAAFCAMAISRGLSAAILNPMEETVRTLWDAASAVSGHDPGFAGYMACYAGDAKVSLSRNHSGAAKASVSTPGEARDSSQEPAAPAEAKAIAAILRGLKADTIAETRLLLDAGLEPTRVIELVIMPALSEVGEKYEKGILFLPQLLQSAGAAQAAFDVLRAFLPEANTDPSRRIVLATVEGDVHDIGKNIVKVLLQNYGFAVTDLGRNVPPAEVLAALRETGATVVGLSALMTTTVPAMKETIALVKRECPGVRIMVGGAVLTESYAAQIGADGYGKDAMAAVRLAREWMGV